MKYDKQWRPSERSRKYHAPYPRHKIKVANGATSEEATTIIKHDNDWHDLYFGIWCMEPKYRLERNLLNKYVGKPFDKFLAIWHERTKCLRNQGVPLKLRYINQTPTSKPDSRWDEFYVDMEGIIRKNPNYRYWRGTKQPIKVIEKEIVKYNLKKEIYNRNGWHSEPFYNLICVLCVYFSTTDYNDILAGGISEAKFHRLVERSEYNGINPAIERWKNEHNSNMRERNPNAYAGTPGWCKYKCFEDLFDTDNSESVYRYVYPGTREYSRLEAERKDASRKALREHKQQKEEFDMNLLHNIEEYRKIMAD